MFVYFLAALSGHGQSDKPYLFRSSRGRRRRREEEKRQFFWQQLKREEEEALPKAPAPPCSSLHWPRSSFPPLFLGFVFVVPSSRDPEPTRARGWPPEVRRSTTASWPPGTRWRDRAWPRRCARPPRRSSLARRGSTWSVSWASNRRGSHKAV